MYKITLARKYDYLLAIVAVACTMAGALAVLAGQPMTLADNTGFVLTGMTFLLLAAVAGSPAKEKRRYFLCFLILLLSTVSVTPAVNGLLAGLYWPLFAWAELRRGQPVERPTRLVAGAEGLCFCLRLMAFWSGQTAFRLLTNVFFVLVTVARGWLALELYRANKNDE